ncbi:MAG: OmpA family protein [Bacteroidales bacterium]|nr:OmpA family protein [Bacteroidales bacterium]
MKNLPVVFLSLFCLITAAGPSMINAQDIKDSKGHPMLTRMPDFSISSYKEAEFESYKFINQDKTPVVIEGHKYYIEYRLKTGTAEPGELKIRKNIQEALKKIGGKVVFDDNFNRVSTILVQKEGKETWFEVRSYNNMYRLNIVEREIMKQEVVANADAMGSDINSTGHVALYGIYFDSGKAEIKPESDASLDQISVLLKSNASLKLYVVGHTDNVGTIDANMKLSKDRADAVANALITRYGIPAARLKSYGVASLAPVTSNDTEEGRAKNRRVELVKQ